MAATIQTNFRMRHSFGKIEHILEIPNLIDIQKRSYDKFLQTDVPRDDRENTGLQGVFNSVFPIRDFNGTSELVFGGYTLERPKYDVDECRQRGMTYAAPIKVTIQLIIYDAGGDSTERAVRDIKEQEVYFGEIPLMTVNGTFIINGTERVVVSQLHRSPGVFFDHDKWHAPTRRASCSTKRTGYSLPRLAGSTLEFDPKDLLFVRIDRRRKLHASVLLKRPRLQRPRTCSTSTMTPRRFSSSRLEGSVLQERSSTSILPGPARNARHQTSRVARRRDRAQEPQVHASLRSASCATRGTRATCRSTSPRSCSARSPPMT